ncbi:cell shape-determining protein MreC [bacterium BMS3Bbin06]|nr:cell shape-determining protein MreC [bacterium BMS3Abin08]GBE35443.1 cell shape-determining protein MreC [bacterium BMS3Bbin06]HDO35205.1 rod shape-determining protein MreC [Nitrospirota bacterium]HDY71440.1 rod shape-determining protein MreC [Nitrospirota bacterium]
MLDKRIIALFLLIFLSLVLMTFQSTRGPLKPVSILKYPLYFADRELQFAWNAVTGPIRDFKNLREKNLELEEELRTLRLSKEMNLELVLENRRLTKLLEIKTTTPEYVTTARVISSGIGIWPRTIVINKGSRGGIERDMVVRNVEGLVGRVIEVMSSFSRVLLITDVGFSASVRLQDSRLEGILSGRGDGLCTLKYISTEEEVKAGTLLVTSGLDGIFPPGIPVGIIFRIDPGDELFQSIIVRPVVDEKKLEEVVVLKKRT